MPISSLLSAYILSVFERCYTPPGLLNLLYTSALEKAS